MPSTRKKSPASVAKKKTLASTKSKSSVKKSTKKNRAMTKNDGLYLQVATTHASSQEALSTVSNSTIQERQEEFSTSTGQAIMQMLHKLDTSNQALTKRMDSSERQNSISSTPLSSSTAQHPGAIHPVHAQQGRIDLSTNQAGTITTQAIPFVRAGIPDHMSMTSVHVGRPDLERSGFKPRLLVMLWFLNWTR